MTTIGKILKPRLSIFVLDVDGVYSDTKSKKLIYDFKKEKPTISKNKMDVTGGMTRKITEASKMSKSGLKVFFVNGNKPQRIIDVGCGTGLVGVELGKAGFSNFDGIDISQEMIDIAKQRGYSKLFIGSLNVSLPCENNEYDAALCVGVFTHGHVGSDRLDELVRIVKPGGIICFTVNDDILFWN